MATNTTIKRFAAPTKRKFGLAWLRRWRSAGCGVLILASLSACESKRILRVTSQPSGALVRLDEDVIGTTPLEYEFEHFGHRRVSLYRMGYQSYSEPIHLEAPWYARFPVDVVTEVLIPLGLDYTKERHVILELELGEEEPESLSSFVDRAEAIRNALPGQAPENASGEGATQVGPAARTTPANFFFPR